MTRFVLWRRILLLFSIWGLAGSLMAQVNVLTYHNNNSRTGENLNENFLRPANVNATSFGKLFTYTVDGDVYAQPLYVSGLAVPSRGTHNAVFVATQHNTVYAFDANTNAGPGGLLWQVNLGPSAATPSPDFGTRYGDYNDIVPEVGITGTPVIDLASGTLYVDTFTHEGGAYYHKLHALNIGNGTERSFSPVVVSARIPGIGVGSSNGFVIFEAKQQLQRSALTLAGGIVYVAYAGYADTNPYHGWILGFNASNLQLLTNYVFNTTPNSTIAQFGPDAGEAGIWMAGCGLAVDAAMNLYFEVGNGSFNAFNNSGGTEYGSSVIRLSTTGGRLTVADYFTPYNQAFLGSNDLDLGSGGLALLPDQPGSVPHLMVGGGKEGKLYLINRDMFTAGNNHHNAGGSSDAVFQTVLMGNGIFATPAYFNGRFYLAPTGARLEGFSLANGSLSSFGTGPRTFPYPGATPSVSAKGTTNGIVWAISRQTPAVLTAYNPTNLTAEIYNSAQASGGRDTLPNGTKFAVPTVANGKVYVGGQHALSVFGLFGGGSTPPSPYDNWKAVHFGNSANSATIAGPAADPDNDHIVNLLEYAHATDPNQPNMNAGISGRVVSNDFQLQFNQNVSATDLTLVVQQTSRFGGTWTNLMTYTGTGGWTANTVGVTRSQSSPIGSPPDQYAVVTITDPALVSSTRNRFYRLIVQQN